jgi:hypothetical protein
MLEEPESKVKEDPGGRKPFLSAVFDGKPKETLEVEKSAAKLLRIPGKS